MNILLQKALLVCPENKENHLKKRDILIEKGIITQIASSVKAPKDCQIIKRPNLYVSIGWFDSSVSFGEPGYEDRETLSNGLRTAALSGFTDVLLNTNTLPIPDKSNTIGFFKNAVEKNTATQLHLQGALTIESKGESLADLYDMLEKGAVAFSDYKKPIKNANLLKIALQYSQTFNGLISSFPMNSEVAVHGVAHEGLQATLQGLKGIPSIAEHLQIQRDLHLLEYTGGKLHIPTISTAESVKYIAQAKKKGLDVSCSVANHNLWGTDVLIDSFNTNAHLLPPLRTPADQKALQKGVLEGTIDMVTSDHNPIDVELKNVEFDNALPGSIGLEASFGVLNSLFSTEQAVQLLTQGRTRFGIDQPSLEEGAQAQLTLFNPEEVYEQGLEHLHSSSKNSLYLGHTLKGKVYGVISNHQLVLNDE